MGILLRDAMVSDFELIAKISVEAYQEYAAKLSQENWLKMKNSLSNVNQTANNGNFIVAEIKSQVVGAIAYYPPGSSTKFFATDWASLRLLAVSPQHRGKGIGKQLTKESISRAKKDAADGIGLYTSEIMITAQTMYTRLGFKRAQELPSMLGLRYWLYLLPLKK